MSWDWEVCQLCPSYLVKLCILSAIKGATSTNMRRATQASQRLAVPTARSHPNRQLHTSQWCVVICRCCLKPRRQQVLDRRYIAEFICKPGYSTTVEEFPPDCHQLALAQQKKRRGSGIHFCLQSKKVDIAVVQDMDKVIEYAVISMKYGWFSLLRHITASLFAFFCE